MTPHREKLLLEVRKQVEAFIQHNKMSHEQAAWALVLQMDLVELDLLVGDRGTTSGAVYWIYRQFIRGGEWKAFEVNDDT